MESNMNLNINNTNSIINSNTNAINKPTITIPVPVPQSKIGLDYVLTNDSKNNIYINKFCKENWLSRLLYLTRTNINIRKLMNKRGLKKEITETYGTLCQIEKNLRKIIYKNIKTIDTIDTIDTIHRILTFELCIKYQKQLKFYDN